MSIREKHIIRYGFSLIELLIVIAVIGIMSAFVFVAFDKRPSHLEIASRQLTSDIRTLQRSALSGSVPSGISGPVCGFGMHRSGASEYQLFVITKNNAGDSCDSGYAKEVTTGEVFSTKTLEQGVQFAQGPTNLYFEVPHGKVSRANNYQITLDGKSYYICVSDTGEVVENKEKSC
jgi:prepilin-type N-terminal cleavage/methylation domain-containing protein